MFGTVYARNAGPSRVIVRRLFMAFAAGRDIQRKSAIGILGEQMDAAASARIVLEVTGWEKLRTRGQTDQFRFDRIEKLRRNAMLLFKCAHFAKHRINRLARFSKNIHRGSPVVSFDPRCYRNADICSRSSSDGARSISASSAGASPLSSTPALMPGAGVRSGGGVAPGTSMARGTSIAR